MEMKVTRGLNKRPEAIVTKPKHRPSRTPTGLPGDEPRPRRQKKPRDKLGDLVDTLLVPEHKAARRLILRSQKRNPKMAAGSNMTLYERIMAYRQLKQKSVIEGESKSDGSEDETRKLDRSDTGWGSVDISQYTNKKDSDDNRTPTPPPTISQSAGSRRNKQDQEGVHLATARDVHVDVDTDLNKKEKLPPVRSTTPKTKQTPSPTTDRIMSRQNSDLNPHHVLPPIHNSPQGTVKDRVSEHSNEDRRVLDNTRAASAVLLASTDRREVKDQDGRISERKERKAGEDIYDKRMDTRNSQESDEKVVDTNHKKDNVKEKDERQKRNEFIKKNEIEGNIEDYEGSTSRDNGSVRGHQPDLKATDVAAVLTTRQLSRNETTPSPHQQKLPVTQKSKSRESTSEAKRPSTEKFEKLRNTPKRKSALEEEIERLDKMVDRDLNEIIRTLGNKSRSLQDDEKDKQLQNKIFDSKFQSNMDKYLRDI